MAVMVVVRGCGAVLARVGVARRFSGIRAGAGPVRYNPQEPEGAKPAKREEGRVAHSRPVQRWKRAPKEWGLRDVQEEVGRGGGEDEDESFAEAEMRRLREEMKLRSSSSSAVSRRNAEEKHEFQSLRARESEGLDAALATKNRSRGEELLCGDLESSNLNREVQTMEKKKKRNALPGSGLVYGDGRKFEGVIPNATDLFDDPFIASEGELFKIAETEEDKTVAKEKQAAKDYALRLLAMAPQPERKLRQKLISRNVSESVIDSTIADLQRCGLQSDLEFAEAFARSRWRSSLWGPQRLKQELRQRGVCGEHIDVALEKVFSSSTEDALVDEEGDLEGRWGMTREASEHLWEKAKLQWRRGGSTVSEETRKRRMVGWLQRRGFNWSITSEILKSLESQD